MKTLYIIRHAKSSWKGIEDDFGRPLNSRGKSNAPMMGHVLFNKDIKPDLIISSPAKRAKTTALLIAKEIGYDKDSIVFNESVYESSTQNIIDIINSVSDEVESLAIVGHNPALTDVINVLSGSGRLDSLPTMGVFSIGFDLSSWKDVNYNSGDPLFFEYPKRHLI